MTYFLTKLDLGKSLFNIQEIENDIKFVCIIREILKLHSVLMFPKPSFSFSTLVPDFSAAPPVGLESIPVPDWSESILVPDCSESIPVSDCNESIPVPYFSAFVAVLGCLLFPIILYYWFTRSYFPAQIRSSTNVMNML